MMTMRRALVAVLALLSARSIAGDSEEWDTSSSSSSNIYGGNIHACQSAIQTMPAKAWDAWGKPGSGIARGNVYAYGNYDECEAMEGFHYCMLETETALKFFLLEGVCVPTVCTDDVLPQVLRNLTFIKEIMNYTHIPIFPNGTIATCTQLQPITPGAKATAAGFATLVLVVLGASAYHYFAMKTARKGDDKSLNAEDQQPLLEAKRRRSLPRFVEVFSLFKSFEFIASPVKGDTIPCLEGMRVLSMMWVVFGHTYYWSTLVPMANTLDAGALYKRFEFQMILNATVSVDTFFFLSGFLVCFGILKFLKTGARFPYFLFLLKRFLRLVPALGAALLIFTQLLRYMGDGPIWPSVRLNYAACHSDWWTVLLFLNNFIPNDVGNACFGWAWYLAVDWDLFLIAPFLVIALHRSARLGFLTLATVSIACLTTVFSLCYTRDMTEFGTSIDYYNLFYIKPWARAQPYLVGILTAYIYSVCKDNKDRGSQWPKLPFCMQMCGHVVFLSAGFFVMFGTTDEVGAPGFAGKASRTSNAFYLAFARMAWGLMLSWITLSCIFGYFEPINSLLSWKIWTPLSRLTYSAYLLHPIILFAYFYTLRNPVYFRQIEVVVLYFGIMTLVYASATVFVVFVELPLGSLISLVFPTRRIAEKKIPLKAPVAAYA